METIRPPAIRARALTGNDPKKSVRVREEKTNKYLICNKSIGGRVGRRPAPGPFKNGPFERRDMGSIWGSIWGHGVEMM